MLKTLLMSLFVACCASHNWMFAVRPVGRNYPMVDDLQGVSLASLTGNTCYRCIPTTAGVLRLVFNIFTVGCALSVMFLL